jgi:hypothetical protein
MRAESKFPSAPLKSVTTFAARGIDKLQGFRTTFRKEVRNWGRKSKMDRRGLKKSVTAKARAGVRNRQANLESGDAHGRRSFF